MSVAAMEEPSVLDYVKSRLKFWRKGKINLPPAEGEPEPKRPAKPGTRRKRGFPWRSMLALSLALMAQLVWEPAHRSLWLGVVLYAAAFGLLIWATLRNEWQLRPHPETGDSRKDPFTVRLVPLFISLPLAAIAFWEFSDNRFTSLNLALWFTSLAAFVAAFWLPQTSIESLWMRLKAFSGREKWHISVTSWGLLVLVIAALVVFFHTYQLSEVAPEMTSDHAEKLLDVNDIQHGIYSIFFPRNTGREPLYVYLTALIARFLGPSFDAIKWAAVLGGLFTLPYLYLLGKELGSKWVGVSAVVLCGIAYWPIVIERFGLRISFYPLFVAVTLYYLVRGLRRRSRNDFILAGIGLGLGLMGYTPFRIMPFVVLVAVGVYLLHRQSTGARRQVLLWLGILVLVSLLLFLPLLRYWIDNPDSFTFRAFSRLGSIEQPLPGPIWQVFLSNLWNGLKMFNWNNGSIWVHSVPNRPALDVVSGALFLIGILYVLIRYVRSRHWLDLFLLLSIPLLQMPSILSLAFPAENPAMNRAAGALVPVFLVAGLAVDGLLAGFKARLSHLWGNAAVVSVAFILFFWSGLHNSDLIFQQYKRQYQMSSWNSAEMAEVVASFGNIYGSVDNAWIVPYPHWVDTRLEAFWMGIPERGDMAMWRDQLPDSLAVAGTKLFIVKPEDVETITALQDLYPQGLLSQYTSEIPNHDFKIFLVPQTEP